MEWTLHNCASMLKCQTMFIRGKNGEDAREESYLIGVFCEIRWSKFEYHKGG